MPVFYYYDDDVTALNIFDEILRDEFDQTTIELIITTKDAVKTIIENKIDILFLDIHITPQGGLIVFEKVREKMPDLPIVFISAGILPVEVEWARLNGLTACIEKPVAPDALLHLVREILNDQNYKFRFIRSLY